MWHQEFSETKEDKGKSKFKRVLREGEATQSQGIKLKWQHRLHNATLPCIIAIEFPSEVDPFFFVSQCDTSSMSDPLKRAVTAVPLTAMVTGLKAARGGTHRPNPQDEAVTFQPPATRPFYAGRAGRPTTNSNNFWHPKITCRLRYPVQGWGRRAQSPTSHSPLTSLGPSLLTGLGL